jgi:hypothetical protein
VRIADITKISIAIVESSVLLGLQRVNRVSVADIELTVKEEERMTSRPTAGDEFGQWVLQLERILNDRARTIVAGLAVDTPSPQSILSSNSSLKEISATSFDALHKSYIEALRKRDLHGAAEALKTVFEFSERHDNILWARRQSGIRRVGDPAQLSDAFSYGPVICCYIGGEYKSRSQKYRKPKGHLVYFHRQDGDEEIMNSLYDIFGRNLDWA